MEHYFPFSTLQEWFDIFTAVWISLAVFGTVYGLASLYYWTTRDLLNPVGDLPLRHRKPTVWKSKTVTTTTIRPTHELLDELAKVEAEQERDYKTKRKRSSKKVRHPDTPSS